MSKFFLLLSSIQAINDVYDYRKSTARYGSIDQNNSHSLSELILEKNWIIESFDSNGPYNNFRSDGKGNTELCDTNYYVK